MSAINGRSGQVPAAVFLTPEGKYVIVAANRDEKLEAVLSVKLGGERLDVILPPRSMHTFVQD